MMNINIYLAIHSGTHDTKTFTEPETFKGFAKKHQFLYNYFELSGDNLRLNKYHIDYNDLSLSDKESQKLRLNAATGSSDSFQDMLAVLSEAHEPNPDMFSTISLKPIPDQNNTDKGDE